MSSPELTVVEAPRDFDLQQTEGPSVFLAGGITGCPPWQSAFLEMLVDSTGTIFNPRRAEWPDDPAEVTRQIAWERKHLVASDLVLFWFPAETECPITLLELGFCLGIEKPMVVGCHPDYRRVLDVQLQTNLTWPEMPIEVSILALAGKVQQYLNEETI